MKRLIRKQKNNILYGLALAAFIILMVTARSYQEVDKQRLILFVVAAAYLFLFVVANIDCLWKGEYK